MSAFDEGYAGRSLVENPYWKNYPKDDVTAEEKLNAVRWVDGYAQWIIDNRKPKLISAEEAAKLIVKQYGPRLAVVCY